MPPGAINAAATVVANGAVRVAPQGISTGSLINTLATVLSAMAVILTAYWVFLPKMTKVQNDRLNALDEERKQDMAALRSEMDKVKKIAEDATKAAHASDLKLVYAVSASNLLLNILTEVAPGHAGIKQARDMLAQATGISTDELAFRDLAVRIAELK